MSLNVSELSGHCMRANNGSVYWPMHWTHKCSFGLKNYSDETQRFCNSRNSFETFQCDCCKLRITNGDTSLGSCTTVQVSPGLPWVGRLPGSPKMPSTILSNC